MVPVIIVKKVKKVLDEEVLQQLQVIFITD
jgi:hypothetical protein